MADVRNFEMNLTTRDGAAHRIKFVFDLSLESHQHIYGCVAFKRLYEAGTTAVLIDALKPGDIFIDVGAHIGYFTLLASSLVGAQGRVFSFEPEERNHAALLNHLRINNTTNVLPHRWALGSGVGVTDLYIHPHMDGAHSTWNIRPRLFPKDQDKITSAPVFATSLDALFNGVYPTNIKAIKIDVEGFETEVLKGMQNLLNAVRVPVVVVEINETLLKECKTSEQEIRQMMTSRGYRIFADEPETGRLIPLEAGQVFRNPYVYNLIFIR
jgi:FkbM family methyltransferase